MRLRKVDTSLKFVLRQRILNSYNFNRFKSFEKKKFAIY